MDFHTIKENNKVNSTAEEIMTVAPIDQNAMQLQVMFYFVSSEVSHFFLDWQW